MAAPTINSIPTILQAAKLAESIALIDVATKKGLFNGTSKSSIPQKIYAVRKAVQFQYDHDPTDDTLRDTANLLWSLLGVYGNQALNALGQGGTVVISGGGGSIQYVSFFQQIFVTGATYLIPPERTYTINFACQSGSIVVNLQGVEVTPDITGDFSYSVVYGTSTTAITFTDDVPDNQNMIISGFKLL